MCIRDSTITQVTGNDQPTTTTHPLSGGSGTYTLNLNQVADKKLKDTYQVMLSVDNGQYESPSTDSFPLYVYNADALQIVNSEDKPITEPVSYTHLDVYKRQPERCSRTTMKMRCSSSTNTARGLFL